ncbi:DUF202 domain-containing protein [Microbacterium sp. No. 7]|uniref:DUF202 domain-containing protein n=1 Tax=Microbacterium sp. No. 7 TaxID=1714373 RepID=UPI0006CFFC24|nr:DUF202 domain-containing protein [Microbacterium sp. No. 7]ALJ21311.1 hypothetical protein AOA12_15945 [Microbacterium sp. No. 7]
MTGPVDPGLQPERTELAWRRTALAIGIGSLLALRILPEALGGAAWALCGVVGLLVAAALWIAARRRYHSAAAALARTGRMPGAVPMLLLALFATAVGAGGVILVVSGRLAA